MKAKTKLNSKMEKPKASLKLGGAMKVIVRKSSDFTLRKLVEITQKMSGRYQDLLISQFGEKISRRTKSQVNNSNKESGTRILDLEVDHDERGDVPGWVLVVLMTTGLVTAIWTIAAPRLSTILRNSLDAMNGIR